MHPAVSNGRLTFNAKLASCLRLSQGALVGLKLSTQFKLRVMHSWAWISKSLLGPFVNICAIGREFCQPRPSKYPVLVVFRT